jgi:DNA-binding IclR family transcriptional regulator
MEDRDDSIFPHAVERAIRILENVGTADHSLSIKEVSDLLAIPHASTYRIVKCMLDMGYLRECPVTRERYRLGFNLVKLADHVYSPTDLQNIAHPLIKALSIQTGHACQLGILHDDSAMIIDQHVPIDSITIIARLREKIPINSSAAGKILTALMPADLVGGFLDKAFGCFARRTSYTIMDRAEFEKELETAARQGYSTDFEEYALGIGCLAVPVLDLHGKPIAALGLTGRISDYRAPDRFAEMLLGLQKTVRIISKDMGFEG